MTTTTESDVIYVDGWEDLPAVDGYRVCGLPGVAWFIQAPPYNRVVAHPPAHLASKWEALDWFRRRQNARKEESLQQTHP